MIHFMAIKFSSAMQPAYISQFLREFHLCIFDLYIRHISFTFVVQDNECHRDISGGDSLLFKYLLWIILGRKELLPSSVFTFCYRWDLLYNFLCIIKVAHMYFPWLVRKFKLLELIFSRPINYEALHIFSLKSIWKSSS
jgi:hypothetical protein